MNLLLSVAMPVFKPSSTGHSRALFIQKMLMLRQTEASPFSVFYQSRDKPILFFTDPYRDEKKVINTYHKPRLFKNVWETIKFYFFEPAQAKSVKKIVSLL